MGITLKARWLWSLLAIAALLGSLGVVAQAAHTSPTAQPIPPLDLPVGNTLVVRAYFDNRQMVYDLARWLEPWEVNYEMGYLVVDVTPDEYQRLQAMGFRLEIDRELSAQINQPNLLLPNQVSGIPGYLCYRTVEETLAAIDNLVAWYPNLAAKIDIGDSWDKTAPGGAAGYDLVVLKLTNQATPGPKPVLFIMASMHAREYTPAELATRFAESLVTNYNLNADATWLLDYHEIHLLLQANPDGRKYAEQGLYWRKNTNQDYCSPTSSSRGADLNRNFSFEWGCCNGSSTNQCDITYRGPSAASEPETQAIQDYVRSIFPDQRGPLLTDPAPADASGIFLDLHSYSELVLWSWGFTSALPPNAAGLQTLGRKFAFFNNYFPQQAIGLYPSDGTTDDFAYGELGLAAYTFELGTAFFQSCAVFESAIIPGNIPALQYAAKAAQAPYLIPSGPEVITLPAELTIQGGKLLSLNATISDLRFNTRNGTEPTQNIVAAQYTLELPPWAPGAVPTPMTASDGAFDQKTENVTASLDTSQLSVGRHIVYVRGQDASGSWGAVQALFLEITTPDYAMLVTPTSAVLGGDAGGTITHTLQLSNTGLLDDIYTVTLSSAWLAELYIEGTLSPSPTTLNLSSGQSLALQVVVTIPAGGIPGDQDTAQVAIASQNQPAVNRTAFLTSVIWRYFFLPLIGG